MPGSGQECTFTFLAPGGHTYRRVVYAEDLYVIRATGDTVLAAARTVPHEGLFVALYGALRSRRTTRLSQALLGARRTGPSVALATRGEEDDLVIDVRGLVDAGLPGSPLPVLQRAEQQMEEAISRSLAAQGIEQGLDSFSDAGAIDAFEQRLRDPADAAGALAHADAVDNRWLNLSVEVDEAIKTILREQLASRESRAGIVLYEELEQDLRTRLFSDPRFLRFIRRVLEAKGSIVSPLVRDFVGFYARALNRRLAAEAGGGIRPDVLRYRIESRLGHEKESDTHHALKYQVVTVLGTLLTGPPPPDETDPDASSGSYRVDADYDPGAARLSEIKGTVRRFVVRKEIGWRFGTHHNVERVVFVDEQHDPE